MDGAKTLLSCATWLVGSGGGTAFTLGSSLSLSAGGAEVTAWIAPANTSRPSCVGACGLATGKHQRGGIDHVTEPAGAVPAAGGGRSGLGPRQAASTHSGQVGPMSRLGGPCERPPWRPATGSGPGPALGCLVRLTRPPPSRSAGRVPCTHLLPTGGQRAFKLRLFAMRPAIRRPPPPPAEAPGPAEVNAS